MEHTPDGSLRISLSDVRESRAYFELSPEAKIRLCELAGAPWSEKKPDAALSPLMIEVISRKERIQILNGGSGLGKSTLGGAVGLCEFMLPQRKLAFIGARYEFTAQEFAYFAKGLKKLFGAREHAFQRFVNKNQSAYHDFDVWAVWGSRAVGYAVDQDDGEALLGKAIDLVIAGEGSRIPIETFDRSIRRALDRSLTGNDLLRQDVGRMICFSTPDGYSGMPSDLWDRAEKMTKGHLDQLHYDQVGWKASMWFREASALENPAYDKEAFEAAKSTIDPAAFAEQYEGKRVHTTGRIYREFKPARDLVEMPSPKAIQTMRLGVGIDTGSYFAAALCGVDREGLLWTLGEVKTKQAHIRDSCQRLRSMIEQVLGPVFESLSFEELAEHLDLWVIDPASQHKIEVSEYLDDAALELPGRNQGKFELIPTIDKLREQIEEGKFRLVEDCQETYDELKKYIWKRTKISNQSGGMLALREPLKVNDHLMDALRFIAVPLLEAGPMTDPPTEVSFKEAASKQTKEGIFGRLRDLMDRGESKGGFVC